MIEDSQAALCSTLMDLEQQFWNANASRDGGFYRRWCTADALFVFPFTVMELPTYSEAVETINDPWLSSELEYIRLLRLTERSAGLVYLVTADRASARHAYRCFVTSMYVRQGDNWLLSHQQHTPIN